LVSDFGRQMQRMEDDLGIFGISIYFYILWATNFASGTGCNKKAALAETEPGFLLPIRVSMTIPATAEPITIIFLVSKCSAGGAVDL